MTQVGHADQSYERALPIAIIRDGHSPSFRECLCRLRIRIRQFVASKRLGSEPAIEHQVLTCELHGIDRSHDLVAFSLDGNQR